MGEQGMARDFPKEVIEEILSWLHVKSLMRFKCVSKSWLHLLTNDPHFLKLHFNRSIQLSNTNKSNPSSILVSPSQFVSKSEFYYVEDYTAVFDDDDDDEVIRFETPFTDSTYVVNICNGLLCLVDRYYKADDNNAHVWNPLTGDHITIPFPPIPSHLLEQNGSKNHVLVGFGFNEGSDEYKVIRFVSTSPFKSAVEKHDTIVSVYTLGGSSWRTLQQSVPYHFSLVSSSTALVNGALHWFGAKMNAPMDIYPYTTLIAFDMQHETFQEIPQPDGINYGYPFKVMVGEMGGLLCIFCMLQHESVEIWAMEEYGVVDSWRRLCKIELPDDSGCFLTPICAAVNGDTIIRKNTWEWISYNPNTNSVRDLHRFENQVYKAYTFKGTLLSPTVINTPSHMID